MNQTSRNNSNISCRMGNTMKATLKSKCATACLCLMAGIAAATALYGCSVSYKFTGTSIDYTKTKPIEKASALIPTASPASKCPIS